MTDAEGIVANTTYRILAEIVSKLVSVAFYVVLDALERNATYLNLNPKGEPQLGKRGLYRAIGGGSQTEAPLLWVLNQSDGTHDLLDIARRSGLPFRELADAADALLAAELLEPVRSP